MLPLQSRVHQCIKVLIEHLETNDEPISNRKLGEICQPAGEILAGTINPHFCHEVAEASVNLLIQRKLARRLLLETESPSEKVRQELKPLINRLPTQTWRSREQNAWQQFSTPPSIAYLLSYLMNFQAGETVLEPSAGTGSLAVWASGLGLMTFTNEIDERRSEFLRYLGFEPTAHNAEFINDVLAIKIQPNCVLMNPPFSANGERTKEKSSKYGFRHVRSALERLQPGGKFGIILGEAAGLDRKTGNDFLSELSPRFDFKAVIKINGREYYKNGTAVNINLVIGRKRKADREIDWLKTRDKIVNVWANDIEDAFEKTNRLNLRLTRSN